MTDQIKEYFKWAVDQKHRFANEEKTNPVSFRHRYTLSGTMAAVLLGLSRYKTKAELYDEFYEPMRKPANIFMKVGTALEPMIIHEYEMMCHTSTMAGLTVTSKLTPWSTCQLDCWDSYRQIGVEIKTAGLNRRDANGNRQWGEGCALDDLGDVLSTDSQIPVEYLCQVMDQMWMMGTDVHRVACLFRDTCQIKIYEIPYDAELAAKIVEAKEHFLFEHLIPGIRPDEDEEPVAPLEMKGKSVAFCDTAYLKDLHCLKQEKALAKEHADRASALEERIRRRMKDCEAVVTHGGTELCTLRPQSRRMFDSAAFKRENADLYDKYYTVKPIKARLTIKL